MKNSRPTTAATTKSVGIAHEIWRGEKIFTQKIFLSSPAARRRRSIASMRLHHLLVSLAVIFITIIAVEGLPQSASPTPSPSASPQAVESPAKKQPAKKKGWWIFGSKASPAASSRVRLTTLYLPGSGTKKRFVCPPETIRQTAGNFAWR